MIKTHPLLLPWKTLNITLQQHQNDGIKILLALRSFRSSLDQYFIKNHQLGSAEDILCAINELRILFPLQKNLSLQQKLIFLSHALSQYDRTLFIQHYSRWQVINGDYNPVQSLLVRFAYSIGKETRESKTDVPKENYQEVATFSNIIFQEDITTAKRQIKRANRSIELFLKEPTQENSKPVAMHLSTLWFIQTQTNAVLHVLKNKELCQKTSALYNRFLLTTYKLTQEQKFTFPLLPENFRKFYLKQRTLELVKREYNGLFQHHSNQKALKQIERYIDKATNLDELNFGLNQLKLYSSFQTIHPLIRLIKKIFHCPHKLEENIITLQRIAKKSF